MSPAAYIDPGHAVLAIPVPALDEFVRARTSFYDAAYLAADPAFGQAHVTLVAPWRRDPCADDLATVGQLIESWPSFDYLLADIATFDDGIIHLVAEPAGPFTTMIHELVALSPDHQPYGGKFGDLVPHVTLDAVSTTVDVRWVRAELGALIPALCRAEEVQLQWWQAGHCHVKQTWKMGVDSADVNVRMDVCQ